MENNNFKVLTIEWLEDMEKLMTILTNNGYEVNVKPVYETEEDFKAKDSKAGRRVYRPAKPRIKHYAVEIVGIVEKPVFEDDNSF